MLEVPPYEGRDWAVQHTQGGPPPPLACHEILWPHTVSHWIVCIASWCKGIAGHASRTNSPASGECWSPHPTHLNRAAANSAALAVPPLFSSFNSVATASITCTSAVGSSIVATRRGKLGKQIVSRSASTGSEQLPWKQLRRSMEMPRTVGERDSKLTVVK